MWTSVQLVKTQQVVIPGYNYKYKYISIHYMTYIYAITNNLVKLSYLRIYGVL